MSWNQPVLRVLRTDNVGDAVVNLREHVLEYRIKYSVAATDDKARQALLEKASRSVCLSAICARDWVMRADNVSSSSTLT